MCDMAWTVLSDRVRAEALAERAAYLMAGHEPPSPEARVVAFAAALAEEPEPGYMAGPLQAVRRLLDV